MAIWRIGIGPYESITFSKHITEQLVWPEKKAIRVLTTFIRLLEHGLFDRNNHLVIPNKEQRKRIGLACGIERIAFWDHLRELTFAGYLIKDDLSKYRISKNITIKFEHEREDIVSE